MIFVACTFYLDYLLIGRVMRDGQHPSSTSVFSIITDNNGELKVTGSERRTSYGSNRLVRFLGKQLLSHTHRLPAASLTPLVAAGGGARSRDFGECRGYDKGRLSLTRRVAEAPGTMFRLGWQRTSPSVGVCLVQLVIFLQLFVAALTHQRGLEITLHNQDGLERAPSCRHSFARIELSNPVSRELCGSRADGIGSL
jgi:hypothetical protein